MFDGLLSRRPDVFVVFLPHAIEPGARNDLKAAQDLAAVLEAPADSYHVMEDDLPARMFKGIIREGDFLIGQRAHSLIGSASVATPLVALIASNDKRTHDILGDMAGCQEQMLNMDELDPPAVVARIVAAIDGRDAIRSHLGQRMAEFRRTLADAAMVVKGEKSYAEG